MKFVSICKWVEGIYDNLFLNIAHQILPSSDYIIGCTQFSKYWLVLYWVVWHQFLWYSILSLLVHWLTPPRKKGLHYTIDHISAKCEISSSNITLKAVPGASGLLDAWLLIWTFFISIWNANRQNIITTMVQWVCCAIQRSVCLPLSEGGGHVARSRSPSSPHGLNAVHRPPDPPGLGRGMHRCGRPPPRLLPRLQPPNVTAAAGIPRLALRENLADFWHFFFC